MLDRICLIIYLEKPMEEIVLVQNICVLPSQYLTYLLLNMHTMKLQKQKSELK